MIKVKKNKVRIKASGEEMVKDLCAAALGVREFFAEPEAGNNPLISGRIYAESSIYLLSTLADVFGVKFELKAGDTDA